MTRLSPDPLTLDAGPLTIEHVEQVARHGAKARVGPQARQRMETARAVIDTAIDDGQPHYGINTGFGSLSSNRIGPDQLKEIQRNLIRSHAAGIGEPFPEEIVRAMMLLLAASLGRGRSGVRPVVAESVVALLNAGVTPVVPSVGSVGASGDLAPLAHVALVLLGEGQAVHQGQRMNGRQGLAIAGLEPLELQAKEGLALINGTHLMAGRGALLLSDARRLFEAALVASAMSIDACRATDVFLDQRVHEARNQPGSALVARRLAELLKDSQIVRSHRENDPRVQDPYSLRCIPPVLGAAHDALAYAEHIISHELGAVTDNPLVFSDGAIISAGNFHGMPLAIPLDALAIALAHIAGISERRVFLMLAAADPEAHLRPYLAPKPGLNSGLMIAQYTAAACCNEIIGLCTPASVSNISTSAGMEDYNSFGPRSAAKAARALELARGVIAIEFLCAAQAIEYHRPLRSGERIEHAHALIRARVPALSEDRPLTADIEAIDELIRSGAFAAKS